MSCSLKYQSGMGVEQQPALLTTKHGPLHKFIGGEHVVGLDLLAALAPAVQANKLSVERVKLTFGWAEFIFKPLDGLFDELRIHRYEMHARMVRFSAQRSTWQVH